MIRPIPTLLHLRKMTYNLSHCTPYVRESFGAPGWNRTTALALQRRTSTIKDTRAKIFWSPMRDLNSRYSSSQTKCHTRLGESEITILNHTTGAFLLLYFKQYYPVYPLTSFEWCMKYVSIWHLRGTRMNRSALRIPQFFEAANC